eukprot:2532307-Rhodomonas_salina.4
MSGTGIAYDRPMHAVSGTHTAYGTTSPTVLPFHSVHYPFKKQVCLRHACTPTRSCVPTTVLRTLFWCTVHTAALLAERTLCGWYNTLGTVGGGTTDRLRTLIADSGASHDRRGTAPAKSMPKRSCSLMMLRICYAMSGTAYALATTGCAYCLDVCYVMSGTDLGYSGTRLHYGTRRVRRTDLVYGPNASYGLSGLSIPNGGTDIRYGDRWQYQSYGRNTTRTLVHPPTQYPVLT